MKKILFIYWLFLLGFQTAAQHTIVMKSGEKIKGVLMEIKHDTLTYVTNGKFLKMHMKNVSSIFFDEYVAYDGKLLENDVEKYARSNNYVIKYKLKNREMTTVPVITCATEDKGIVVVKIIVDMYGNVLAAEPGATGSTTANNYLYAKAQIAAKEARFSEYLTGPIKTEGTITIEY